MGLLSNIKQRVQDDSSTLGVLKNTITGVPSVLKKAGTTVSSFVRPTQTTKQIQEERRQTLLPTVVKEIKTEQAIKSGAVPLSKDPMSFVKDEEKYFGVDTGGLAATTKKVGGKALSKVSSSLQKESKALLPKLTKGGVQAKELTTPQIGQETLKTSLPEQYFNPQQYVKEQVKKRESARTTGSSSAVGKVKSFLQDVRTKLVDSTTPIEDALASARRMGTDFTPTQDIRNKIDRVLRSPTIAGQFARDKGIAKVIREAEDIDMLDQYLIGKHALELEERGIKTGRNLSSDKQLIENLSPKYESLSKEVANYSRILLDRATEAGLVSKETSEMLKKRYPDYVPFNRVFSDEEVTGSGIRGVASLGKQTVLKSIKGSEREIESPIESLLARTNDVIYQAEKNEAARLLASYKDLPGNPFQLKEIKDVPGSPFKATDGKDTITFFDNGKKRTFETTKEIAEAAKSLNVQQMNILGKILAFPVRIARMGLTGLNLPFIATNIARDQVGAFINSKRGLKTSVANPKVFLQGLFEAVRHGDLYKEIVREGGMGTSFDIARDQLPQTVAKLRSERSVPSRILYTVKNPSEMLRAVEDLVSRAEEATRIQQYKGTKDALIKRGMSEQDAMTEAAKAARENSVNFMRRGEWGTVLNSVFLYLNAGIQGSRTLLRAFKERPVATSIKTAVTVFQPVAYATLWNLAEEDRAAAYADIPDFEKEGNLIIIPPNPTQDANGKWNVIKIPLPQGVNSLASLVRRPIEQAKGLDPLRFKEVVNSTIGAVSPIKPERNSLLSSLTPQAIKPPLEVASNYSFFSGLPIIPKSMEKLSPENQVRDTTSGTARQVGGALGVSPINVEYLSRAVAGGLGSQVLNAADQIQAKIGTIPKEQVGGQSIREGFVGRFAKASGGLKQNKEFETLQELQKFDADETKKIQIKAEEIWNKVKDEKDPKVIQQRILELAKEDKEVVKKLVQIAEDDAKGLTSFERSLKNSSVAVRAKYVSDQVAGIKDANQIAQLLASYKEKGILTKSVIEELSKQ